MSDREIDKRVTTLFGLRRDLADLGASDEAELGFEKTDEWSETERKAKAVRSLKNLLPTIDSVEWFDWQ